MNRLWSIMFVVVVACSTIQKTEEDLDLIRYKANLFDRIHQIESKSRISIFLRNNHIWIFYYDGKRMKRAVIRLEDLKHFNI